MKQKNLDILKQKGSGFKMPQGYFDTVEADVFSKLFTETLSKTTGYSAPKGYFETIEDTVSSKLDAVKLPEKEGYSVPEDYFDGIENSVLDKLGKKTATIEASDIPEGYFDTLEDRVFEKLKQANDVKEVKVISLGERFKKALAPLAVAATIALLFMIGYNRPIAPLEGDGLIVEELIEENLIDLNSYEIAEVFSDVDLATSETISEEDVLLDYLNGTDVESMLLEN